MAVAPQLSDARSRPAKFPARVLVALLLAAAALIGVAWLARGRGYRAWVSHKYFGGPVPFAKRPSVTATRPGHYDGSVPLDAFVAADLALPNSGYVVDARTVTPQTVRL